MINAVGKTWGKIKLHCIKIKFYIKEFFSECEQFLSFVRICSYLLKKYFTENFGGAMPEYINVDTLRSSGLVIYILCKWFAVQTHLW